MPAYDSALFPDGGHSPYYASQMESKNYELTYNLTDGSMLVNSADGVAGVSRAGVQAVSSGSVLADAIANELIPSAAPSAVCTMEIPSCALSDACVRPLTCLRIFSEIDNPAANKERK